MKITIALAEENNGRGRHRKPREVVGELVGSYLAVHKRFVLPGEEAAIDWRITHLPTGCAVRTGYKFKKDALEFANAIKHLDWSKRTKAAVMRDLGRPMQALMSTNPIKSRA